VILGSASSEPEHIKNTKTKHTKNVTPITEAKKPLDSEKKAHEERVRENFQVFWIAYPRKEAKASALKAFKALFPLGHAKEAENSALKRLGDRLCAMTQELEDGKKELKYVPYAATWLRREDFFSD